MTSNFHVTFSLGFVTMVILILTLSFTDSAESSKSNSTSAELDSDSTCSFECKSPSDYKIRLTKMEKMDTAYKKLKKTSKKYFGVTKNPMEWWKKVMDQLNEIGPEGVLQLIQSLKSESGSGSAESGKNETNGKSSDKNEAEDSTSIDGGGWRIIQKRMKGPPEEFDQNWNVYEKGFGAMGANFWLGLAEIRELTKNGDQELRIDMEDHQGEKRYAKYSSFSISDARDYYRLSIGGYSGDAGDSLANATDPNEIHNGMQFTTRNKDNDRAPWGSCAKKWGGGWWFNYCHASNLNGVYFEKGEKVPMGEGILWKSWKGWFESLAKVEMKIRTRGTPN